MPNFYIHPSPYGRKKGFHPNLLREEYIPSEVLPLDSFQYNTYQSGKIPQREGR